MALRQCFRSGSVLIFVGWIRIQKGKKTQKIELKPMQIQNITVRSKNETAPEEGKKTSKLL
jgi:molybdopterin synthase catalytic subunit